MAPDNRLMAAEVNGRGTGFEVGAVRPLFEIQFAPIYGDDVAGDGQRFLVIESESARDFWQLMVVVNWLAELKSQSMPR